LNELDVIETVGSGPFRGHTEHPRRQIDCYDSTAGLDSPCRSDSRITSAARDVEHTEACAPPRYVAEPGGERREIALRPLEPCGPSGRDGVPVFPLSIPDERWFRGSPPIGD